MAPIRLLVVDDHTLFRRGLIALLSQDERFDVAGEAADMGEALRCAARVQPDLVLLDNHLPGVLGVDGIVPLKDAAPLTRVLMLTVSENEADLAAALNAGADGYLLKTVELDHLADYIGKVLAGESVISPEMMTKLVSVFRAKTPASAPAQVLPVYPVAPLPAQEAAGSPAPLAPRPGLELLSAREREILTRIARGESNKVIARGLGIAETTVKIHVQHILRKLQLSSRVQAAVMAVEYGFS